MKAYGINNPELTANKLEKFYNQKAKETVGGSFYAVVDRRRVVSIQWGRSRHELTEHLQKARVRFDRVSTLQ